MIRKSIIQSASIPIIIFAATVGCFAGEYERAGWKAKLSTLSHGVSGVVEIVDADTIRIEDFNYDGGAQGVFLYMAAENTDASFLAGVPVGPLLSGTERISETLTVEMPAGLNTRDYNAVSVWSVDLAVNFGSGTLGSVVRYEVTFDATWSETCAFVMPSGGRFELALYDEDIADDDLAAWWYWEGNDALVALARTLGEVIPLEDNSGTVEVAFRVDPTF